MELTKWTGIQLSNQIKKGEITIPQVIQAQLEAIFKREEKYYCYIQVMEEEAMKQAELVQKEIKQGKYANSPLAGVPIAVKDNICTKGIKTTCGSKMLSEFIPPYEATVIEKIKAAGMILIGKTNMDEFAMGSTTETSYFGVTKNPWNIEHVPGGSSGGSAAAVAAEETVLALGSDTGGSIRQPSAFCGVIGLKPTYGRVSRYGLIAYASSFDQIGPIARNVSDCAALFDVILGEDKKDSTYISIQNETKNISTDSIKGMKIGILKGYLDSDLDNEVKQSILDAIQVFKEKGASFSEFELEAIPYAIPAYYVIASAEASSNLSRYDGVKYGYRSADFEGLEELYCHTRSEGFGDEAKRRIMIGSFVLSSGYYDAYYKKALKVKALIKQSFDKAFEQFDLILTPTAPTTAPKLGESLIDPLKMYRGDSYTVSVNLAGLPAIAIPCGNDSKGLPIGLQLIGKPFEEKTLFCAASSFEQTRPYQSPIKK